jgi:hypothetical protein
LRDVEEVVPRSESYLVILFSTLQILFAVESCKRWSNVVEFRGGVKFNNDLTLVTFLKEELRSAKFVSARTRELVGKTREDIDLHLQAEHTKELWKELLRDAIVFLKSNDSREKHHDQMTLGLDELCRYLEEYSQFEQILYGALPNYRDHIAHTLRVMLLGDWITRGTFGFANVTPKKNGLNITDEEKEAMWAIMALTHDLGLPLQAIRGISQRVRDMLYRFGMVSVEELASGYFSQFADLSDFVLRFLSSDVIPKEKSYVLHIQAKYYQKFLSALSSFNHGVISSIILMKNLAYFKESEFMMDDFKPLTQDDATQFLIRKEILRAIASHSCDDIYYLSIVNFPFMLSVFDEMQEWGRPRLMDVTKRVGSESELCINKFDQNTVDYKIRFSFPKELRPSDAERQSVGEEIKGYFITKCNKWLNVLRSAVGLERNIELRFEVEDETPKEGILHYVLDHKKPDDFDIQPEEIRKKIAPWKT